MSLYIKIDSVFNISDDKLSSLMSKVCESIMQNIINQKNNTDMHLNYNVNLLKTGFKKIKEGDSILKEECSICYNSFNTSEYKRKLYCSHFFHKKCIDKWLKTNYHCPICRSKDI